MRLYQGLKKLLELQFEQRNDIFFNFWQHGKYIKQLDITGDPRISFHLNDIIVA